MKYKSLFLCTLFAASFQAHAIDRFQPEFHNIKLPAQSVSQLELSRSHAITIYNKTGVDIVYTVEGDAWFNMVYAIANGASDSYHVGIGDEDFTFIVGQCNKMDSHSSCAYNKHSAMTNCVSSHHYNGNNVKEIRINSLNDCTVTCMDGSNDSCEV